MMATAAKVTIAEVEHLVEVGELEPDLIHTPSIYVKRIFQGELYEKKIERRTVRKDSRWSLVVGPVGQSQDWVFEANDQRPRTNGHYDQRLHL